VIHLVLDTDREESVGLELDNKAKTLKLRSAVQGTMQPQVLAK
jgi:hypothetical protein